MAASDTLHWDNPTQGQWLINISTMTICSIGYSGKYIIVIWPLAKRTIQPLVGAIAHFLMLMAYNTSHLLCYGETWRMHAGMDGTRRTRVRWYVLTLF